MITSSARVAHAQRILDLHASVKVYRGMKDTAIRLARTESGASRKDLVKFARRANRVMIITLRRAILEQAQ